MPRAIESVLLQTCQCAELLVIDDGSTDDTGLLLKTLAKQSEIPLKIFFQPNKGPASARNLGIKNAQCEMIAFLDSDDHWHKQKLEIQYHALAKNPQYLISHTYERWLRRGEHLNQKKKHIPRHGNIFDHCLQLCAVGMSTVLARQELFYRVGFFDESLRCCEDYDFWLRVSCRYWFLLVADALTVKEGGREDQVSNQYRCGMDRLRIDSLGKLLKSNLLSEEQCLSAFREYRRKTNIFGNGCLKHNREDCGRYYLDLIAEYRAIVTQRYPQLEEILNE